MSRRSRKETEAEQGVDDDLDGRDVGADADDPVSRTARKRASDELQDLGEQLVELRRDLFAELELPDNLVAAINEARRLTNRGAQRRQAQYLGKLMRRLEPEALDAVRAALSAQRGPTVEETALLHRAERWRETLLADDAGLERWLAEFPGGEPQRLRSLIRQARKDAVESRPGEAVRRGQAYRQIFALLSRQLREAASAAVAGSAVTPSE